MPEAVKRSRTPEAIAYQAAYYLAHKEKLKAAAKAYREADLEADRAKQRERRAANIEKVRERDRARLAANRTSINARRNELNAQKRAMGIKRKTDPVMNRIYRSNRRALERYAHGRHTKAEILAMFDAQKGQCVYCHTSLHEGYHKDHIKALARGGSNDITNIQLLCAHCNQSKHAKDAEEFASSLAFRVQHGDLGSGRASPC